MIIVKLQGGLGNQLFQYAAGKSLALKNKTNLKLDLSDYINNKERSYKLKVFNIEESFASKKEIKRYKNLWCKFANKIKPWYKRSIITYSNYGFEPDLLKVSGNAYLDGYWQNEKYFSDFSDIIKKEFTLKTDLSENAKNLLTKINDSNSISLHIRRGDYLSNSKFNKIYQILDKNYYLSAIDYLAKKIPTPSFFIFTDDVDWAEKELIFSHPSMLASKLHLPDYEELILMSQCQHNIIANSSFSWWGAWLNKNPNKIVVAPKKWYKTQIYAEKNLLLPNWTLI